MNLDYRSTQCPLGKITSFFPSTQNWAVFQWTIKLPGMLTGMPVCVSAALLKQLNAGKSTLKEMYLLFLHGQPFPHRIISQAQSTSYHIYFNYGINIFLKSQHKFLSININIYIYMHIYIYIYDPMNCSLPGSSDHGDFPGKNTRVGCHFPLQGIFQTQGSNLGLLHCRQTPYWLSHKGSLNIYIHTYIHTHTHILETRLFFPFGKRK